MLTLVGMQGVGTSSCYDRKVRSEIHSPAAYHHKSTDCLIKITVHLQLLTTPHQIRAVRSFGEYRPGENEIDVSARQRSQQLWRENPQFRAILAVNFESENDSNKLSGGEDGIRTHEALLEPTPLAGERLRPLGHLSTKLAIPGNTCMFKPWLKHCTSPGDEECGNTFMDAIATSRPARCRASGNRNCPCRDQLARPVVSRMIRVISFGASSGSMWPRSANR